MQSVAMRSSISGARYQSIRALPRSSRRQLTVTAGMPYPAKDWISRNPIVLVAAFLGWTIPASIPSSVYDGNSLFGAFVSSVGSELANWPQGPPLESDFWGLLLAYHCGLFACMMFGQIGYSMRIKGYFKA